MKTNTFILILAFWICCASCLSAQTGDIVSRQFTLEDGLPHHGALTVMQDSLGFIWFGSYSGLSKFDGYSFKNYRNTSRSLNSLGNNWINDVLEDQYGRLWIAHRAGLDLFDPRAEKFLFHWPDSGNASNNTTVSTLRKRKDKKIWVCTSQGIFVADPHSLDIEKFNKSQLPAIDIAESNDGSLSIAMGNPELGTTQFNYLDSKTGEATTYPLGSNMPRKIHIDKKNRVWLATDKGLKLFDTKKKILTHYLQDTTILCIQERDNGKFWLTGNSLYEFDPETGISKELVRKKYMKSILTDRQSITWLADIRGVQQINPGNKNFAVLSQFGKIDYILEDSLNMMWVLGRPEGQDVGSLIKFDPSFKQPSKLIRNTKGYPTSSLFTDHNKNIWLAAELRLEKFNALTQRFKSNNMPFTQSISGFMDSYGMVWIGGWSTISRIDPNTGEKQNVIGFPNATVFTFLEDANHNLWIGSTAGLSRYNLKTGKLDTFKSDHNEQSSLPSNSVFNLMMDKKKTIWIGTADGIAKMVGGSDGSVPKFINWRTTKSGLPSHEVNSIVEGADETLWMNCGVFITHFFPAENKFKNYDRGDGLSDQLFSPMDLGVRSTSTGYLFFESNDGLVTFHPDSLKDNPYVPPVVITNFSMHNQPVPVKGTDADSLTWETPLNQCISYTKDIVLDHFQNDFTFEFAALNYVNPESNQYKYKLEPYEKEWIETNAANRVARYTNISPGKYTFRVIASNDDGVWNEEGVSLAITITPPWWRTAWAYAAYGLLFMAGLWRVHVIQKARTIRNEREKSKERELAKAKEIDQLKTSFFTNISHEFRTPLTLIKGPVQEMLEQYKQEPKLRERLKLIERNSDHLLKLINQLLDLAKLESGNMTIEKSKGDINAFIIAIVSSFYSLADHKHIDIQVDLPPVHYEALFDKDKLETILINLINNAIKFTPAGGVVTVKAEVVSQQTPTNNPALTAGRQQLTLHVKDTGIGIPEEQQSKIFERFHKVSETHTEVGTGIGLALVKEIVTLLNGSITVKSKSREGSEFTVVLPVEIVESIKFKVESEKDASLAESLKRKAESNTDQPVSPGHPVSLRHSKTDTTESETEAESAKLKAKSEAGILSTNNHQLSTENGNTKPHILVVEDHRDLRGFIIDCLGDEFYFLEAENGKQGLEVAIREIPDLIISDIMMPEMDGIAMTSKVKSDVHTSHIPLILLTAKSTEDSKLKGLEKGADDYLTKPFNKQELLLKVRNAINRQVKVREKLRAELMSTVPKLEVLSADEKFLNDVKNEILKRLSDEQFSVEVLAEEIGLSRSQLYRKIIALTGISVNELIRKLRMQKAAQLLEQKWGPIAQVAYEVGISNLSYFSKVFKEEFGVLPSEYSNK